MKRALLFTPILLSQIIACGDEKDPPSSVAPLALITAQLPAGHVAREYSATIKAEGGVPPYIFSLTGGALPDGVELTTLGVLTGLSVRPGDFSMTITVSDSKGTSIGKTFEVRIEPDPLEIGAVVLPMGREGMAYERQLTVRGGVDPKTWSIGQGALPAGISLSSEGVIGGAPTAHGVFDFTVRVTDAEQQTADRPLTLTVIAANPMIQTTSLMKARLGQPYQAHFAAEGGASPYDWTIAAGALPDGMNLATDGTLLGTPLESGEFSITVRARDANNRTDAIDLIFRVLAPLVIATTQINQAIHHRPYDFQLQATGGELPYTWQITSSAQLPLGIMFNSSGRLSGMTDDLGDTPVTVRVTDADGINVSAQFVFRVSDRFRFDVAPTVAIPAVCTGTTVAFTAAELHVVDSMQILDLDVEVNVSFPDPGKLKLVLQSPQGELVTLCGVDRWSGCEQADLTKTYDDDGAAANRPDTELTTFDSFNPIGRWRLITLIENPRCGEVGVINSFALTIQDDRDTDPYIAVRGFSKNNLIREPWIRIDDVNAPDDGVDEHELFLSAVLYEVGANGFREGGLGDDIPSSVPLAWEWETTGIEGTELFQDGYVHAGELTGQARIVASSGSETIAFTLRVVPPDWQPAK